MLCEVIRQKRQEAGMTQNDLAEKLNCRQSTVSGWERGDRTPRIPDLYRMAEIFGCKASDFV